MMHRMPKILSVKAEKAAQRVKRDPCSCEQEGNFCSGFHIEKAFEELLW